MDIRGWLAFAALASVLAAYGAGRHVGLGVGAEREVARQRAATEALQEKLDRSEAVTLAASAKLERDRDAIATRALELEEQARQDPQGGCRVPSPDSLRRLRTRFAATP